MSWGQAHQHDTRDDAIAALQHEVDRLRGMIERDHQLYFVEGHPGSTAGGIAVDADGSQAFCVACNWNWGYESDTDGRTVPGGPFQLRRYATQADAEPDHADHVYEIQHGHPRPVPRPPDPPEEPW